MNGAKNIYLIVLSLAGLIYGAYILWDFVAFAMNAEKTQGQIIARDNLTFTIQYSAEGQSYRITQDLPAAKGASGLERMSLVPGAEVAVLYDPAVPSKGRWDANRNWLFPALVILVSTLVGLAGLFPDIAHRKIGE